MPCQAAVTCSHRVLNAGTTMEAICASACRACLACSGVGSACSGVGSGRHGARLRRDAEFVVLQYGERGWRADRAPLGWRSTPETEAHGQSTGIVSVGSASSNAALEFIVAHSPSIHRAGLAPSAAWAALALMAL